MHVFSNSATIKRNGGSCIEGQDDFGLDFFVCDCASTYDGDLVVKYVGRFCEIPVTLGDYCPDNDPNAFCVQGGTCRDFNSDNFDMEPCNCPVDRTGKNCEFPSSALTCTLECSNGGICRHGQKPIDSLPDEIIHRPGGVDPIRSVNFMYCECKEGFAGSLCDYEYITCGTFKHFCFNNAVCQEIGDEWTCLCDFCGTPGTCCGCMGSVLPVF